MVNPNDAFADTIGLARPSAAGDGPGGLMPQLFSLALFRAGKDGCECDTCRYMERMLDLMIEGVEAVAPAFTPAASPNRARRRAAPRKKPRA